ncbi:MAG TPA: signal peptidase I, partial [Candidatus Binataceae bacterium]|nr:signal peptidase I [Candidatus Binataceae bacterium]
MAEAARNYPKPGSDAPRSEAQAPQKSAAREYGEAFGIALILALIIRTFFIQAYKIPSGSMEPTLLIGDHILVNKLIYGLRVPDSLFGITFPGIPWGQYVFPIESIHRGDVVVFVFPPDPTKDFIKRVIGLSGDTVQVKDGKVWLNGSVMDDPHAHFEVSDQERSPVSPRDNFGPVTVPAGKLLMMGDNRDRSYDGRFWGFVDANQVEGRAILIYWSWDSDGSGIL